MDIERLPFLLAIVSTTATLAGLGFAFYGLFNIRYAERIVDKKVESRLKEIERKLTERMLKAQEAMQKITSGYALAAAGEHERAIALFEAAVAIDPEIFNGYTSLAYEYWATGRKQEAIECFQKAARVFPERYEPYNDLARIYAQEGEINLALRYIEETLKRNPDSYREIEQDPVFDFIRKDYRDKFAAIVNHYKPAG